MSRERPARRGLGRGLGSLIPTGPPDDQPPAGSTDGTDGTDPGTSEAAPDGPELVRPEGSWFAEVPADQIEPNRVQPRQVFDEEAMAELVHSIREVGLLQPIVVRQLGPESYELVMGERRWRAARQAGLERDPRHRPGHRRHRHAPRRAAGEPAPLPAQPARGGGRLPAAAGGLRLHPRRAGPADRPVAAPDQQHHPAAQALPGRPAPGGRRSAQRGPRPVAARRRGPGPAGPAGRPGGRRGHQRARPGGDRRHRRCGDAREPPRPGARPVAPGLADLAERLSDRLETRVKVDLGRRKGKITVEFGSLDDLRRIVDIMDPRNRSDRPI